MIIINDYGLIPNNRILAVAPSEQNPLCPSCEEGYLKVHDTRLRTIFGFDPNILKLRIRRLRCPVCGRLHAELPDILEPYKRYAREVILAAITDKLSYCPAENSTIHRWIKEYLKDAS